VTAASGRPSRHRTRTGHCEAHRSNSDRSDCLVRRQQSELVREQTILELKMALNLFPGTSLNDFDGARSPPAMLLENDGYYWHLYPYFEAAKLLTVSADELIDLYGSREIEGYELSRLREQMIVASKDLQWRGATWDVVTGWNEVVSPHTEIREVVHKSEMLTLLDRLIALIDHCQTERLKLCVWGD
jgi:hypothetical protein